LTEVAQAVPRVALVYSAWQLREISFTIPWIHFE
jgi:hypothetical protein